MKKIFVVFMLVLFLIGGGLLTFFLGSYFKEEIEDQFRQKAELLMYSMKAVRKHVGKVIRPKATEILGKDKFVVELQSTSFAANHVFARIPNEIKDGLKWRTPSIKPMNPDNKATPVEENLIKLLDEMHSSGQKPVWRGIKEINGVKHYVIALGTVNKAKCIRCHSSRENAPLSMRSRYAFNYPARIVGRVESAEIVSIPLSVIAARVRHVEYIVAGSILLILCLLTGFVFYFFNRMVNRPVTALCRLTQEVATGNYDYIVQENFKWEFARLFDAISQMVDIIKARIAEAAREKREAEEHAKRAELALQEVEKERKRAEETRHKALQEVRKKLERVVIGLLDACKLFSERSKKIFDDVRKQKEHIDHTVDSVAQMSASVEEVTKSSSQAVEHTQDARTKATTGAEVVTEAAEAIEKINELTDRLKLNMEALKDKAGGISQVMTVISDIADQTNLLALNAAIEAARAGEAGRGFAVVADEVRKLAEKTMAATKEVGQAISEIQSEVEKNVGEMNKVAGSVQKGTELAGESHKSLQEIVELVVNVADQVSAIAEAAKEQSSASNEISASIADIKDAAEDAAGGIEETKDAVEALERLAEELRGMIEELVKD